MVDEDHKARLNRLEEKLEQAKSARAPKPHVEEKYTQANLAWRMVIELVVGVVIGAGMGLGLDAAFGTRPIFLVLFIFFGLAAGVKVMMRTANEFQKGNDGDRSPTDEG